MSNLKLVTITGADDSVQIKDLVEITKDYPFVEWGILMSRSQAGFWRFPSQEWKNSFASIMTRECPDSNVSLHLCGQYVRDILEKGVNSSWFNNVPLWDLASRCQLNFHGVLHSYNLDKCVGCLMKYPDIQFILQNDEVNFEVYCTVGQFINSVSLFDISHGSGMSPDSWPQSNFFSGFAGGLGPHNIKQELPKIFKVAGEHDFWIDMETNVRTPDDSQLDLNKVVQVLAYCKEFINV